MQHSRLLTHLSKHFQAANSNTRPTWPVCISCITSCAPQQGSKTVTGSLQLTSVKTAWKHSPRSCQHVCPLQLWRLLASMSQQMPSKTHCMHGCDPADAVYNPQDLPILYSGLQLVPVRSQHEQGCSSTATPWHMIAQDISSLTAQMHTLHQQHMQQLALVQQDHLQQLAALRLQQQQPQQKKVGKWQQFFWDGSTRLP